MESWSELLLRTQQHPTGQHAAAYKQGYLDGVSDAMVLVGAALAGMWFCALAAFPRLHVPLRRYARPWLHRRVQEGEKIVAWFQQVNAPWLDKFHNTLALMCGVEFYITLLPFLFWIGEPALARSMTIFCASMTYIGNALKDVFCSPRPDASKVRRPVHALAHQGDTAQSSTEEYGFPSTHSINAICFAGYLIHFFNKRGAFVHGEYWTPEWWPTSWLPPVVLGLVCLWCGNICYGRIYLGMHTPVDIVGGVLLGWLILFFWIVVEDFCDAWITAGFGLLPVYQLVYSVVILWAYPVPERPNPSFSYSLYLTAACNGMVIGVWRTFPRVHSPEWAAAVQLARGPLLSTPGLLFGLKRFLLGIPVVLLSREVGKQLALLLLPRGARLLRVKGQLEHKGKPVPGGMVNLQNGVRFVAYTCVGWAAADLCFVVFDWLGI